MLLFYPLGYAISGCAAAGNEVLAAWVFAVPEGQAAVTKEVFVVQPKLFEAGAGHVGELEFSLFRSA